MRLGFVVSNRIGILVHLVEEEFVGCILGLEYICGGSKDISTNNTTTQSLYKTSNSSSSNSNNNNNNNNSNNKEANKIQRLSWVKSNSRLHQQNTNSCAPHHYQPQQTVQLTKSNTSRFLPTTLSILLNHIQKFIHTIFLDLGLDYDTDGHG